MVDGPEAILVYLQRLALAVDVETRKHHPRGPNIAMPLITELVQVSVISLVHLAGIHFGEFADLALHKECL